MQVIDIRITPASDAGSMSRVCFIGEGGDEVAVTIADHHEGGATIEQELVAKAKVMLLHAAAAQVRDVAPTEPETVTAAAPADEDGDPQIVEDASVDHDPPPVEASTSNEVEADAGIPDRRAAGSESRSGLDIDPLG